MSTCSKWTLKCSELHKFDSREPELQGDLSAQTPPAWPHRKVPDGSSRAGFGRMEVLLLVCRPGLLSCSGGRAVASSAPHPATQASSR